jgi:hypothetical protein
MPDISDSTIADTYIRLILRKTPAAVKVWNTMVA